ncbi:MAG: CpaF family protein, partial [Catenulispora sp.]|nr:CpaF family protein [Catenulispora sp.]
PQWPPEQSPPGGALIPATPPNGPPVAPQPQPPQPPAAPQRPPVNHDIVGRLKKQVADQLHEIIAANPKLSEADRRQHGMALINKAVGTWTKEVATKRGYPATGAEYQAYVEAVYDAQFRHGRLQPYLDDQNVENILINGFDEVWVDYADRPRQQVPPIADSDEELVKFLQELGRRYGGNNAEREVSNANPMLALRLGDGSRLQAVVPPITPKPFATVRRHLVKDIVLQDMIRLGTLDPILAMFLQALVKARKNILICGDQGAGKTSLLRAMAREIPATERFATLETEYELWLHQFHDQCVPMETRQANGERVGEKADGSISIGDMIPAALRMTLSRMIVGEVRSDEIVYMLRVMTSGSGGSMSTMHVRKPDMIWDRIAELCADSGVPADLAYRLAANAIDFVVFVALVDETQIGGRRHRFVSHVVEVAGGGEGAAPSRNTVFGPRGADPRAVPLLRPACSADLRRVGFDLNYLDRFRERGQWPAPLDLKVRSLP